MSQAPIYKYPLLIRESHLDTFGHVNNATYLQIYEEARWDLITKRGYGLQHVKKTGLGPIILEINIKFKKELTLRQEVVIETQMQSYEKKIGLMKQWIKNSSGEICADMDMTFALFDTKERKIVLPTPDWLKAIGLTETLETSF